MKNFKQFNKYITSNKIKLAIAHEELNKNNTAVSKMDKLLDGIISGTYANDEEAAWDLYQSNPKNKGYQMLKARIKDRLISHVFQTNTIRNFSKSRYHLNATLTSKFLTAGQLLINFGIVDEGERIIKQAMVMAKRYQFSGQIVAGARLLRSRAGYKGTRKEVNTLDKIIEKNLLIYAAEIESDGMKDNLHIDFRATFAPQKKEKAKKYWDRINVLNDKYDNHVLKINKGRIGAKYFETIGDFKSMINVCDEVEDYLLSSTDFYDLPRHREFATAKIEACLFLKEYELGKKNAEVAMSLFSNLTINAVIVFEYYVLLCLHAKNYAKAWELFDEALANPLFKTYPQERIEKWKLFEAYLSFVYPNSKRKFKLFKFLNEVTVYSKDKKGLNVSIMIAQIILLLDEGNFDMLIEKAASFIIYFKRYISKHLNYRTFYFVKMIELLFQYNFNYEKVSSGSNKFFKRLKDKAGHYQGDIESLEVIPYEELWNQILLRLKRYEFSFEAPTEKKLVKGKK